MKYFIAFLTTFLCVNAYIVRVDSISSASSEEPIIKPPRPSILPKPIGASLSSASSEELIVLPHGGPRQTLGVLGKSILQAVKVKRPQHGGGLDTNRLLVQNFAPQDVAV